MQTTGARVIKNTSLLVLTELVGRILGILVLLVAARQLGAASFGVLAFAYALAEMLSILVVFGFDTLLVREIARDTSATPAILGRLIVVQGTLTLVALLVIAGMLALPGNERDKQLVVALVAVSYVAYSFTVTFNAFFRAHQLMQLEAVVRLVFSALRTLLVIGVLLLGYGILTYVLAELAAYSAGLAAAFALLSRRIARPQFTPLLAPHLDLMRKSLPFVAMTGLVTVYVSIDVLLLSILTTDVVTGWYAAATKFFFLFSFLPRAAIGAILPVMAQQQLSMHGDNPLLTTSRQTFRMLFVIGLPIAVGIAVLAEPIVLLFYGEQFLPAAAALRILMLALLLGFANWAGDSTLISLDKEVKLLGIVVLGALFNVTANLIVIPLFGHIGAAATTVASEGLVLVCKLCIIFGIFRALPFGRELIKPLGSGMVMAVFLFVARDLPVLLLVVPAAGIYVGALLMFRTFSPTELHLLWTLLPLRVQKRFAHTSS